MLSSLTAEDLQVLRGTQRHIAELSVKIADTNDTVARISEDLTRQIAATDARAKAAEQELRDRIQALVSGIGSSIHIG